MYIFKISFGFASLMIQECEFIVLVDRFCRRSAVFLTKSAIFAGWQSPLQKYISLPLHTSVFGISKRHAHKVFIKCPVSKLRLRLQTVETGHYFCSLMPLRNAKKPRQIPRAKIFFCMGGCHPAKIANRGILISHLVYIKHFVIS